MGITAGRQVWGQRHSGPLPLPAPMPVPPAASRLIPSAVASGKGMQSDGPPLIFDTWTYCLPRQHRRGWLGPMCLCHQNRDADWKVRRAWQASIISSMAGRGGIRFTRGLHAHNAASPTLLAP